MKKTLCLITVMALVLSLACTVFAAQDDFVDSITYKGAPELVPDEDGNIGVLYDEDGQVIDEIGNDCLVITSIADIDKSDKIPEDAKNELKEVYEALMDGSMKLPYEGDEDMVIRELIDASWLCVGTSEDHEAMLKPEGVTLELTFDLGVGKDVDVTVMTYVDGKWSPIVSVKNNGDGTVTCVFEEICPIAFSVPVKDNTPPAQTGDQTDLALWIGIMCVSALALAAVVVLFIRKNKTAQ